MSFLVQVIRKLPKLWQKQSMAFADLQDLRLIGNARGQLINNKAGRAVFRAKYGGAEIKLYEAYSTEHARFISALSTALPDVFPAVIELRGAWVMAEWVVGEPLPASAHAEQLDILQRIHALPTDNLPTPGFCYWQDFLLPRFKRAATLSDRYPQIMQAVEKLKPAGLKQQLIHPDLSPANLLKTADGRIVSIDNELLSLGRWPLLDLCNAMRPLPQNQRELMAANWIYSNKTDVQMFEHTALAWLVREAGAAFVAGQLQRCQVLLDGIEYTPLPYLPFSYNEIIGG